MNESEQRTGGWQLDRSAPEAYESYLVPAIFVPWTRNLLDTAALQDGERVLDVGCGTGIVARNAAETVGGENVVGVDLNEGMLEIAERATSDTDPAIDWRRADASDLPFPDGSFDVVLCQQALQFFEDPSDALADMHRVLAPGGRIVCSVWRPIEFQPGYAVLAEALERHVSAEAGTMMRSPFPSWNIDRLHELTRAAGFGSPTVTIEIGGMRYPSIEAFVRREAASSPMAEKIAELPGETREALLATVAAELEEYIDDQGLTTPMESSVLVAGG